MQIEQRKLADITPYDNNPRVNDDAVDAVATSIREFGFRQPIVVDEQFVIIVGHTRYKAALKLNLDTVPVHIAKGLSPAQAKAYRIADNQTARLSEWDYDRLPIELAELQGMDFPLDLVGFSADELLSLMGTEEGQTDPDFVPDPPDEAITQPGQLWILGDHRLLCGDSSDPAAVDRLLDGATIHLVNTDPPYNVRVEPRSNNAIAAGLSSFQGTTHHQGLDVARHPEKACGTTPKLRAKDRPLANDFVSDEEFDRLLHAWFGNIARVLEPGCAAYIWGGYANCGNYPPVLKAVGLYFSQAIIWDKQHPVLTRKDFMGAHEWCQPDATAVLTPDGRVPISSLRDGDRVISFRRCDSVLTSRRGSIPVRKTQRPYNGRLVGVIAGGKETWCTPGHIWSIRLAKPAAEMWCVYLMRRGRWWRIGKSKLISTWGFGVKHRLKTEDGDAAWILSVHRSNLEATIYEQVAQVKYGIPTTTWNETYQSRRTLGDVSLLYDALDSALLEQGALRALNDHGRNLQFPFLDREYLRGKVSARVSFAARACNLIPGVMLVPVPNGDRDVSVPWLPISDVKLEPFDGIVHSLAVPSYEHYIADGLVTHNCFYTWKEGAAHRFFGPNNATDLWHVKKVNPQSMSHLTEKPVELATRAMEYSSRHGENVLDLFGGSGSTLIGAQMTGRRAFLMEIDPLYCDVIVQRWEQFTGEKAQSA